MAHQVVGLDIGTYSIKAAVFDTTFRSMVLSNLIESSPLKVEEMDPQDQQKLLSSAISHFIAHYKLEKATFCSTLSGKDILFRIKDYPFGPKQALKVLPNDIGDEIPIPLHDLMIEHHHFLAQKNHTVTHAVCAQNEIIQTHLQTIQSAGIEPSFISVDSFVLLNVQQFLQHHPLKTYAIVDIGHTKTSLCVISNQQLIFVRTLLTGGSDINTKIRQHLDLTLDQSIEVKEKHGIIETDFKPVQSKDLKKLSFAIQATIDPLFREILQTIHMFRSQQFVSTDQKKIEHVFFCGGSSLIRQIPDYFTSLVNIKASIIDFSNIGADLDPPACAKFSTAIGSALKFASKGKNQLPKDTVNFRKGPYSLVQDFGEYKDKGVFYAKWFGVLFVLLLTLFIFKNQSLKHDFRQNEQAALRVLSRYAPESKVNSSKDAIRFLKTKVVQLQQKQELLTSGLNQLTALDILREISVQLPTDIPVDTRELSVEKNKVTFRGNTNSYASVDRMIGIFSQIPSFDRIEKGAMKETSDGKIEFQITILIDEQEGGKDQ